MPVAAGLLGNERNLKQRTCEVACRGQKAGKAGFVTKAAAHGATDRQIMRQTGHKSRAMIDRLPPTMGNPPSATHDKPHRASNFLP